MAAVPPYGGRKQTVKHLITVQPDRKSPPPKNLSAPPTGLSWLFAAPSRPRLSELPTEKTEKKSLDWTGEQEYR
jgi:hypothetical protein